MLLLTNSNQTQTSVSYQDLLAQSDYTILYFYPKDDTPGCTLEAQDFRTLAKKFKKLGTQIIGVSRDDHKSHCKFINKYGLNFQLISDLDDSLHKQFDTIGEKSMYGKKYIGTIRSSFLVDKKGKVLFERRKVSAKDHAKNVLEKVQKVVMVQ